MDSAPPPPPVRFGTFTGVFLPTLLTILGVILFVRMGWVVGNAGLGGALLILGLGILITTCTGLSLSSIATNTRIGPGGPYAILNKSLGLEVGGSVGIPLYLTRPLGVAMYIIGFREGLLWIAPGLPAIGVDLAIFALLFGIAFRSADLAFKTQYFIMGVIGLSLISIFASPEPFRAGVEVQWWGRYPGSPDTGFTGADFWMVFAVFFPATTGILAGANMSGDLEDPRRAIPAGTLWAIFISSVIYVGVAFWVAHAGTPEELAGNYNFIIDKSLWPPLVIAGLLGATASSALAGLVGGPRILMAMGQNRIVPWADALAETKKGEPRNAIIVTGILTVAAIMVRDLNAIAPLVTMFFLITYCMINVVVLVEGRLGLVSYRPTLRIPLYVPFLGLVGCLFSMFIVSPVFSLVSLAMVVALYIFIRRKRMVSRQTKEDVRSSIFTGLAEWAASRVTPEDLENVRAWKPNLLIPVDDPEEVRGAWRIIIDLARPEGTIKLLGVSEGAEVRPDLDVALDRISRSMRKSVLTTWSVVEIPGYTTSVGVGLMALQGAFFRPNVLFLRLPPPGKRREDVARVIQIGRHREVGVLLYSPHPAAGLGEAQTIHLWIRRGQGSWSPDEAFEAGNLNLILLMGFRLWRLWGGELKLMTVVADAEEEAPARAFLDELCELARFPAAVERCVRVGEFDDCLAAEPPADVSVFGLHKANPDLEWAERVTLQSHGSALFVLDSGRESARA